MEENSTEDYRIGNSTTTTIEFARPKFQATIPESARRILDVTEETLEYEKGEKVEKVVCSAEITVEKVYTKEID